MKPSEVSLVHIDGKLHRVATAWLALKPERLPERESEPDDAAQEEQ